MMYTHSFMFNRICFSDGSKYNLHELINIKKGKYLCIIDSSLGDLVYFTLSNIMDHECKGTVN